MNDEIIVNYVAGSCYNIEIGDYFLVFEYYNGILNVPDDKKTIFLASSKNEGHYSEEILKVSEMENFTYVLSSDIAYTKGDDNIIYLKDNKLSIENLKNLYKAKNVNFLEKDSTCKINKDLVIDTISYENKGMAFVVKAYDFTIFYGGDLFLTDIVLDRDNLISYLYEIYETYDEIDLAFFPILKENGEKNFKRAKDFIEILNPQIFFPTNFDEDKKISEDFLNFQKFDETDIRPVGEKNTEFIIDLE